MLRTIVELLGATWRLRVVEGERRLAGLVEAGDPVVLSYWHEGSFVFGYFLYTRMLRRGFPLTVFASHSRDGELAAKLARLWRADVVRGSATRGGSIGLRALYRALVRRRSSPLVIPDGPQGPIHKAKAGAVVLAQMAGVPIIPLAFSAARAWKLGSWDRMVIPRPFSRVTLVVGEPIVVARELDDAGLEAARLDLERRLIELGLQAAQGQTALARSPSP